MIPKWDDSFSVRNEMVDEQHKELFRLAGEMEEIFDKPVSREHVKELLAEFFNYMKTHFADEEKYMQEIGYPELEHHKMLHKDIVQKMIDLIKSIKTTNDLKEKLYVVAKEWLLEHILYEDMKVAEFRGGGATLASDNAASFEDFKWEDDEEESEEEKLRYYYTCGCAGKIHDVPYKIHKGLEEGGKLECKNCKKNIKFHKAS